MAPNLKSLPAEARREFEHSLAATEKIQPEYRATLAEALAVTDSAGKAIDMAHKTTLQAKEAAVGFTEAAKALSTAFWAFSLVLSKPNRAG